MKIRLGNITALVIIGMFIFTQHGSAADNSTILHDDSRHIEIQKGLEYLIESEKIDHMQAASPANAIQWQSITREGLSKKKFHTPVWLRFNVTNNSARKQTWLLDFGYQLIDYINVIPYYNSQGIWAPEQFGGNNISMSTWQIRHRHFLFPLNLPANETTTLYCRFESSQTMTLTFNLWKGSYFWIQDQGNTYFIGMFFGALTVILLYSLVLFVLIKDINYLFYFSHILSVIFYELSATGIGRLYIWGDLSWLQMRSNLFFPALAFLVATFFIRQFLSLSKYGGWVNKLNILFLICWIAISIKSLFPHSTQMLDMINAVGLLSVMAGTVTSIYLWAKGNIQAKFYTIAYLFLYAGTVTLILGVAGIIAWGPVVEYSQMAGFIAEFILLAIALSDRISREQAAREKAQIEALDLSIKISKMNQEKIKASEEIMEVQQRANKELELKVLERTDELQRAMRNLELANKELSNLSLTDPLTKVYNRRYFDQILESEYKRGSRTGDPVTVVIVDIDHFKYVNDTYGHLIGDECLRLVAITLGQQVSRETDLLARYGGEEFVFILPATSQENGMIVADRARTAVENIKFIHKGNRIRISVSIGVAGWVPKHGETADRLVKAADKAMYEAKEKGRNKAVAAGM